MSGRVADSGGNGISGATLELVVNSSTTFSALSFEDGSFELNHRVPNQRVELQVAAEGYVSEAAIVPAEADNIVIDLLRSGRLVGTALDVGSNRPVEDFKISLFVDGRIDVAQTPDVYADFHEPNGEFEFADLPHKEFDVLARAKGYQPAIMGGIQIGGQPTRIILAFEKARAIHGSVKNRVSGEAIANARVYVWNSPPYIEHPRRFSYPGQSTNSSEDGFFVVDEAATDDVNLYIRADGFPLKIVEVDAWQVGPVNVLLSPGSTVNGRLIGVDGNSPTVGSIVLENQDVGGSFRGRIASDGSFEVRSLKAGNYILMATSEAGKSEPISFSLKEGEALENLRVHVIPGNLLRGQFHGLMEGEAAFGVAAKISGGIVAAKKATDDGNFELKNLPTGRIEVVARTTKLRELSRIVDLEADSEVYLDFFFSGSTNINGRITKNGSPVENGIIHFIPLDANFPRGKNVVSDDGRYSVEGMAHGQYEIRVNGTFFDMITLHGSAVEFDIEL